MRAIDIYDGKEFEIEIDNEDEDTPPSSDTLKRVERCCCATCYYAHVETFDDPCRHCSRCHEDLWVRKPNGKIKCEHRVI